MNENYNNQNEDNINKNEHNSTGNNGVLESLKNSCKYRGCLFPGEQLCEGGGGDKHINLKNKLNLKGGQTDDNSQYNEKSRKGKRKNRCEVLTSEANPNPEKLSSTILEKRLLAFR